MYEPSSAPILADLLKSLDSQNYSNYQAFLIDDSSFDTSENDVVEKAIASFPRASNRLTVIRTKRTIGKLAAVDTAIRKFCQSGDIVIDVEVGSVLVGTQVFNVLNRIYEGDTDIWLVYANFLTNYSSDGNNTPDLQAGQVEKLPDSWYRQVGKRSLLPDSIHLGLRSYLFDLYTKIPVTYLLEPRSSSHYLGGSRLINHALIELAGTGHSTFLPEYLLLHNGEPDQLRSAQCCRGLLKEYTGLQAQIVKYFKPLSSLAHEAKLPATYVILPEVISEYV